MKQYIDCKNVMAIQCTQVQDTPNKGQTIKSASYYNTPSVQNNL